MESDWELVSFVIRGKYRRAILENLKENTNTPTKIATEKDFHLSHVSRGLRELSEKDLVEPLVKANKGKIYRLTEKGGKILEKIEEENL